MSSRGLLLVGVLVLACCCCRGNVDVNMNAPSRSAQENAAVYIDEVVSALRREAPSLVPLASTAGGDQVFGTNDHLLDRIDTVMRRFGANTLRSNESGCTELSYELDGRQSLRLAATVVWVDTASECAARRGSPPEVDSGSYRFIVRIMMRKP